MNYQASALFEGTDARRAGEHRIARLRCIAVGSGKGGVGKTTVSVGLAYAFARLKFRVLLVDADLGLANVDIQVGLDPQHTLQDVVFGHCRLQDAVASLENGPDILPASSGSAEMVDMGAARRQMLVDELITFAGHYDMLVIDVGAGIGSQVTSFLAAAPEVAIVVANEPTSIMDAYSLIKVLSQTSDPPSLSLVVNMVRSLEEGERLASRLNDIARRFLNIGVRTAGILPYDPLVGDAIRARVPISVFAPRSPAAQCLEALAQSFLQDSAGARTGRRFFDSLADLSLTPDPNSGRPS